MASVLIMEDEKNICLVLETALADAGHSVETASDGLSGMRQLYENSKPDIALVDLRMPGLDGRGVVEKMRCDSDLKDIPVVIMSGSMVDSGDYPPENFYEVCIEKPFDLDEVIEAVDSLTQAKPAV